MKLKYFYKTDHNKQPIPGSNIRRKSIPGKQWKEFQPHCCDPQTIEATGGWRYFVQLDAHGRPVDGSLVKRQVYPNTVDGTYQELNWKNPCCV